MPDCLTPIDEKWPGWTFLPDQSTSDVLYVEVNADRIYAAIELGWLPCGAPLCGKQTMMVVKGLPGVQLGPYSGKIVPQHNDDKKVMRTT